MDYNKIWDIALTATGIGGLGAFVFWSLHKEWLKLRIFAKLNKDQTYNLMKMFLSFSFSFAVLALFLYVYINSQQQVASRPVKNDKPTIQQTVNGDGNVTLIGIVGGQLTIGEPKKEALAANKQATAEKEP